MKANDYSATYLQQTPIAKMIHVAKKWAASTSKENEGIIGFHAIIFYKNTYYYKIIVIK